MWIWHGPNRWKRDPSDFDVVLTTYDTLVTKWTSKTLEHVQISHIKEKGKAAKKIENPVLIKNTVLGIIKWFRVVMDETQKIKNCTTMCAIATHNLMTGQIRLLLAPLFRIHLTI